MIKQVVFDIGNVLSDFQWKKVIDDCGFDKETSRVLAERIFLDPLWAEYDRGVMGDANVTAALRKNCAGYEEAFDLLFQRFGEFVKERPFARDLLVRLKEQGYGVYVLSNYGETMYHCNAVRFHFLKELDGGLFSYREKLLKPDAAIYRLFLERYGLLPEETLFLDDRPENVEGAKQVGICAYEADSEETILAALAAAGVKLHS